jgi:hypothetical protein
MTVQALLDRLECVRSTGPGRWLARCPAHEDRSPSLSIRETDDGRVLLHDFGGCGNADIVAAAGLSFGDLFPRRETGIASRRMTPSRPNAADALAALDHEATVIAVIAADLNQHREIDEATWKRLALAASRIGETRAMVAPLRVKP